MKNKSKLSIYYFIQDEEHKYIGNIFQVKMHI